MLVGDCADLLGEVGGATHRARGTGIAWGYIEIVRTAKIALVVALCVAAGLVAGLWMASQTYACAAFCLYPEPRFAVWLSCLVGGIAVAIALVIAGANDRELFPQCARGLRKVSRFLFEDLSRRQVR
jgi:hypothetical protein